MCDGVLGSNQLGEGRPDLEDLAQLSHGGLTMAEPLSWVSKKEIHSAAGADKVSATPPAKYHCETTVFD